MIRRNMIYNQKRNNQDWKHKHENDFHQKKKDDQEQVHTIKTSYNQEVDGLSENMIKKTTWSQERGDQEWEHTMGRQSWIRT